MHDIRQHRAGQISGSLPNHKRAIPDKWSVAVKSPTGEDRIYTADINGERGLRTIVMDDDSDKASLELEVILNWKPGQDIVRAYVDNRPFVMKSEKIPCGFRVWHRGVTFDIQVRNPRAAELARHMPVKVPPDTSNLLLCPMPGVVVSVLVSEGQEVQDGQALAVVEAMKMENTLRAESKCVVAKVNAAAGDNLAVDDVIMEFVKG